MSETKQSVAIIGAGVAGLTAAYLLRKVYDVHLYERNNYLGGHTRTIITPNGTPVDTGFIVMNHRNYPLLTKLFGLLDVSLGNCDMSFSYYCEDTGYMYAGTGLSGVFAQRKNMFSTNHWQMIRDIRRFGKEGYTDLHEGRLAGMTLGDYFDKNEYSQAFLNQYLYPMGAAIWSSPLVALAEFPAEPYFRFFDNHGLMTLANRPLWKYVLGGSHRYVEKIRKSLSREPILNARIQRITRNIHGGGQVTLADGTSKHFNHIVFGVHADEVLPLLSDADDEEKKLFGAWKYLPNEVVLHTCQGVMPPKPQAWASWNFTRESTTLEDDPVSVSYYMNRLQQLAGETSYFVTLNRTNAIPEKDVINRTIMTHPKYDATALATQEKISSINGKRDTWYCGSYLGHGFHEDAVRSAVRVARELGVSTL